MCIFLSIVICTTNSVVSQQDTASLNFWSSMFAPGHTPSDIRTEKQEPWCECVDNGWSESTDACQIVACYSGKEMLWAFSNMKN